MSQEQFRALMYLSLWGTRGYPCLDFLITRKWQGIFTREIVAQLVAAGTLSGPYLPAHFEPGRHQHSIGKLLSRAFQRTQVRKLAPSVQGAGAQGVPQLPCLPPGGTPLQTAPHQGGWSAHIQGYPGGRNGKQG